MKRTMKIAGCDIELYEEGNGAPLLFLHPAGGFDERHPYVADLAKSHRFIAPSHPGFGHSELPAWIDSVDDIAHMYLELMDELEIETLDLVGCSLGGWIAVEMATKAPERFRRLVLVGPVGVKTGASDQLDIPDIFVMPPKDVPKLMFHDPARMVADPATLSDDELKVQIRNRETLALLVWEPYMHNPKLPHRLHRISSPTLLLRGESDGLVSASYLERYARLIPGAAIATIPEAGHAPQLEQPNRFSANVLDFLAA